MKQRKKEIKKQKKVPQSKYEIERDSLKYKYGRDYHKIIKERKNYPFGRKSKPVIIFEMRK